MIEKEMALFFVFINQHIFGATHFPIMDTKSFYIVYVAYMGEKVDWAYLAYQTMIKELQAKKNDSTLYLESAYLLSALCEQIITKMDVFPYIGDVEPIVSIDPAQSHCSHHDAEEVTLSDSSYSSISPVESDLALIEELR